VSFEWPLVLVALLLVPLLVAAYVRHERRRTSDAARFTNPGLLPNLVDARPGWRRHLPLAVLFVALVGMIVGVARPHATVSVPREEATVMIAIDASLSMRATDVKPSRLAVAQAAALAVLDVFEEEGLTARAEAIGETIRSRMLAWQERWEQIGDVRGLGAMLAIELVSDPESKTPDAELASAVVEAAAARGLLLLKSGIYSNCIRVLTPLVISEAELDEALEVWEQALDASLA